MLEHLLKFSVTNRWLILLFTIVIGIVGLFSMRRLPIDAVPDITNIQVQVNTLSPSLSPFEIEQQVTFPLETALAGIPGLEQTRSLSRNGFSQITAIFEEGTDIYFARQQVKERLDAARQNVPPGAEPMMGPVSTGLGEVYMYLVRYQHPDGKGVVAAAGQPGWQSNGNYLTPEGQLLQTEVERAAYLRTVQDWMIRPQLRTVRDVAGVDSIGGYEKQYHVQPDPMKLVSYGMTFHNVIEALERNNVSIGAGYVERNGEAVNVRVPGRLQSELEIAAVQVGSRHGTPIYIRDLADVVIGRELRTGSASSDGQEAVVGTALMLIGGNSRTVAAAVDNKMSQIRQHLPPDVEAVTVLNRTKLVDATIGTVEKNLTEGAVLVIAVLFLLLGNIRAAIVTACAIPLAMLVTIIGMVQTKTSGNLMSLGAVDFGLIVDGAVIIVENTLRHLAQRQHAAGRKLTLTERTEIVITSAKEMIQPSVFGQAIIITVYLPILFLTGTEGKTFHPMALTVIFALIAAFVLSMTFIPAVIGLVISGRVTEEENFLVRGAKAIYRPALRAAIRARWGVVVTAVILFAGSLVLFTRLGSEFIPTLDEKDISVGALRIPSTGLMQAQAMQFHLEKTLKDNFPEITVVFSKTGTAELASDPMPMNQTDTFVMLKPQDQWRPEAELDRIIEQKKKELPPADTEAANEQSAELSHKAKLIELMELVVQNQPGDNYEFTQPIQMRFNELLAGTRGDVAVKVFGDDFEKMVPAAEKIAAVLRATSGSADVKVEQTAGLPMMTINVDRAALARYGLNMADVQDVVAAAVGGREVGQVFEGDRRFDLMVRLPDAVRQNLDAIRALPIPIPVHDSGDGDPSGVSVTLSASYSEPNAVIRAVAPFVSLGSIARITIAEGPNQISRENGKRRVVVTANVRDRDIGSFVDEARGKIDNNVTLPAGYFTVWGGQFENLQSARQRLMIVVPACFAMIFLLLFASFGSVKHATLVFACVPLALSGGVAALWLRDMPFSISAAVGFIALSGVAVLNGLVMITFINQLQQHGKSLHSAVTEGAMTRFRPVMMTALVASLGFVPMALAHGTGAEVQKPLATVVIGGLTSATLLTLLVLPALYCICHKSKSTVPAEVQTPTIVDTKNLVVSEST